MSRTFNFKPLERSKELDFSKVKNFIKEMQNWCGLLVQLGARFSIEMRRGEYVLTYGKLDRWANEFLDTHNTQIPYMETMETIGSTPVKLMQWPPIWSTICAWRYKNPKKEVNLRL